MNNVETFINAVVSLVNLFVDALLTIATVIVGVAWFIAIGLVICVVVYVLGKLLKSAIGYLRDRRNGNNKSHLNNR